MLLEALQHLGFFQLWCLRSFSLEMLRMECDIFYVQSTHSAIELRGPSTIPIEAQQLVLPGGKLAIRIGHASQ